MTLHTKYFALQMGFLLFITGAAAETILNAQNITATEGSTVTLHCRLPIGGTTIIQVNWNYCNNVHIAFHVSNYDTEGMVPAEFSDRVSLAKDYGITIQGVRRNDSGQYCCIFNTFPLGKFTDKIYLQVLSPDTWSHDHYLWIGSGLGILLVVAVIGCSIFCYKKNSQTFYTNIHPTAGRAKSGGSKPAPILSTPNPAPIGSTPNSALIGSPTGDEEEESNEYFNIILYNM